MSKAQTRETRSIQGPKSVSSRFRINQWELSQKWRIVLNDLAQFDGRASVLLQEANLQSIQDDGFLIIELTWPQSFASDLEQLKTLPKIEQTLTEYFATILEQQVQLRLEISNDEDSNAIKEWAILRPLRGTKEFEWKKDQLKSPALKILEAKFSFQLIESRILPKKQSIESSTEVDENLDAEILD